MVGHISAQESLWLVMLYKRQNAKTSKTVPIHPILRYMYYVYHLEYQTLNHTLTCRTLMILYCLKVGKKYQISGMQRPISIINAWISTGIQRSLTKKLVCTVTQLWNHLNYNTKSTHKYLVICDQIRCRFDFHVYGSSWSLRQNDTKTKS